MNHVGNPGAPLRRSSRLPELVVVLMVEPVLKILDSVADETFVGGAERQFGEHLGRTAGGAYRREHRARHDARQCLICHSMLARKLPSMSFPAKIPPG